MQAGRCGRGGVTQVEASVCEVRSQALVEHGDEALRGDRPQAHLQRRAGAYGLVENATVPGNLHHFGFALEVEKDVWFN